MAGETWQIDLARSEIRFSVRHLMLSKVRGRFRKWQGSVHVGTDFPSSGVDVRIQAASLDTGDSARDAEVIGPNLLDAAACPEISFLSRRIRGDEGRFKLVGDLSIRRVSREVGLDVRRLRATADQRTFSARAQLNRSDWGLKWNPAIEAGGVLVGETVDIEIDLSVVRATG